MKKTNLKKIIKLLFALAIVVFFIGGVSSIFYFTGVFDEITSIQQFSNSIYGYIMYMVTYLGVKLSLFIPLSIVVIPFSGVVPAWVAIGLSTIVEVIGSVIIYYIGFFVGKKVIVWMTDQKTLDKWNDVLEKGKYTIFLLMLFPFAPEQIIKILCGSGKMSMKLYLPIILIAQPIGIATTVLVGKSIFFSVENLPFWVLIMAVPVAIAGISTLMFLSFKHQDKLDKVLGKVIRR